MIDWTKVGETVIGGLALAGAVAFVGMVAWYVKVRPVIATLRKDTGDLKVWKEELMTKEGGPVTRDAHFRWCEEKQENCKSNTDCRLCEIEEWRTKLMEAGGPLTLTAHLNACERMGERIGSEFGRRLVEGLQHNAEIVAKGFEIVNTRIDSLTQEVRKNNGK